MSHPPELIQKILALIQRDYRPSDHAYRLEMSIPNLQAKFLPDIAVYRKGGKDERVTLVCVVEIGYTRPEKLAAYCEAKIPDVRWYDKAGNLYCVNRPQRVKRPSGEFTDLIIGNFRCGITGTVLR